MIGIYCITNKINGKMYIGQSINIDKRIKEHFWKARLPEDRSYNSALHQAIRKYGDNNFQVAILEECNYEELDEKEQQYILDFDSLSPNGYNILTGGQNKRSIPVFCNKCGVQITRGSKSGLCQLCVKKESRIVERPSKEELYDLLKNNTFVAVAKMFGVSDNAVRKWCEIYGLSRSAKDYK